MVSSLEKRCERTRGVKSINDECVKVSTFEVYGRTY